MERGAAFRCILSSSSCGIGPLHRSRVGRVQQGIAEQEVMRNTHNILAVSGQSALLCPWEKGHTLTLRMRLPSTSASASEVKG